MINAVSGLPPIVIKNIQPELKNLEQETNNNQPLIQKKIAGLDVSEIKSLAVENESSKNQAVKKDEEKQNNVNYNKIARVVETSIGNENMSIEFVKDEEAEQMVMKVFDKESKELIKQFPPEITLKIARLVATILETTGQITNAKV